MRSVMKFAAALIVVAPLESSGADRAVPMTSTEQVSVESIQPAACRGRVIFAGQDRDRGSEPWITDGTPDGTKRLKDIWPGPRSSMPSGFAALGDRVVFWAEDAAHGRELRITDGTEAGTTLLKDIVPGKENGSVQGVGPNAPEIGQTVLFNGSLYFFGERDAGGPLALYRTDGTEEGTVCLGPIHGGLAELFTCEDGVYLFQSFRGPCKVDGTHLKSVSGSRVQKGSFPEGAASDEFSSPDRPLSLQPVSIGRTVFFIGDTDAAGFELWKTDGTESGTLMVRDIRKGFVAGYDKSDRSSYPQWLTVFNNEVYFVATDDVDQERGRELWKTDGTEDGTVMVKDINPGRSSSNPASLVVWNNALYFTVKSNPQNPRERALWKTEGTEQSTVPLRGVSYLPRPTAKLQPPTWPLAWPMTFRGSLYAAGNPYSRFGIVRMQPSRAYVFEILIGPPVLTLSWRDPYANPRWVLCDDAIAFIAAKRLWRCASPTDGRR